MIASYVLKQILKGFGYSGNSLPSSAYLALSTTKPNKDGTNVTEPSGFGYERKLLGGGGETSHMGEPTEDSSTGKFTMTNTKEIHFNEATGDWGSIKYFALYTAKTGGNMCYAGELTTSISPTTGTVVLIKVGELSISLSAEELSA